MKKLENKNDIFKFELSILKGIEMNEAIREVDKKLNEARYVIVERLAKDRGIVLKYSN